MAELTVERVLETRNGTGPALDEEEWAALCDLALEALRAREGVVVPREQATKEMARAWVCARHAVGVNPDELEPRNGTGQGDLQMVPKWVNIWDNLNCDERYQAMLAAAPKDVT